MLKTSLGYTVSFNASWATMLRPCIEGGERRKQRETEEMMLMSIICPQMYVCV